MMLKLTNFMTRPIAVAAAIALLAVCLLPAMSLAALVTVDTILGNSSPDTGGDVLFTPSATDLINQGQSTFSSQTSVLNGTVIFQAGAVENLNDGGIGTSGDNSTGFLYLSDENWQTTFNLDVSTNTLGYDIDTVTTYSGWNMSNVNQRFNLWVSVVGDASFTDLGLVDFTTTYTEDLNSLRLVTTDNTGLIATGVDAVRFVSLFVQNVDDAVFREIDVFGTATIPEPSSMVLVALGLVGMVSLRKRNRC